MVLFCPHRLFCSRHAMYLIVCIDSPRPRTNVSVLAHASMRLRNAGAGVDSSRRTCKEAVVLSELFTNRLPPGNTLSPDGHCSTLNPKVDDFFVVGLRRFLSRPKSDQAYSLMPLWKRCLAVLLNMTFAMIGSNSFLALDTHQRRKLEWALPHTTRVKLWVERWNGMEGSQNGRKTTLSFGKRFPAHPKQ